MKPNLKGDALDFYERNAPICKEMRTLTDADHDTFVLLCTLHGKIMEAERIGADTIRFVCLVKQFTNLSKLFGLDPVSRKKLGVLKEKEDTEDGFSF